MSGPPTKREMRIDPQGCSGAELMENLGKVSQYTTRFATEQMYVGALYTASGEPIYQDGTLMAKRVFALNILALEQDQGKVRVDANDPLAFLIDQLNDVGAYNEDRSMLVKYSGIGPADAGWGGVGGEFGSRIQLNADWTSVHHYDDEDEQMIVQTAGVVNWVLAGQVKTSEDDTLDFLFNQFNNQGPAFDSSTHLKCAVNEVDVMGDKLLEVYADWAEVDEWSDMGDFTLLMSDGAVEWTAFGHIKLNIDDVPEFLEDKLTDAGELAAGDLKVRVEVHTVGDREEIRWFVQHGDITGGDGAHDLFYFLTYNKDEGYWELISYQDWADYNDSVEQAMIHAAGGAPGWIDTAECDEEA